MRPEPGLFLIVDDVNVVFIVLNTFVGFTTSVFSGSYIAHELETGRLTHAYLRFYHAMYQTLMFAMNLALLANNVGLMWVAVELATLTTVLMVGIYRTHEALEAAWKYFILGSVGIALALFGTILVYLAVELGAGRGSGGDGLERARAARRQPSIRRCSTSRSCSCSWATARRWAWPPCTPGFPTRTPRARRRFRRCCPGLLLNVALFAVLRFKMVMSANSSALAPGPLMVTLGLVSVVFAAFMLYRRDDIKRMFAYSSIEHMGIISFAFGMGGPLANFAGLLHMIMHSLTKSAIFFSVGHIAQVKGTQKMDDIRGLTVSHPVLGWGLDSRRDHDRGLAADRHLHERVPDPHLDLRARAGAGRGAGPRPADRPGRAPVSPERPGLRRSPRQQCARPRVVRADVHASRAGAGRGHLSAAAAGFVVPARRGAAGLDGAMTEPHQQRRSCATSFERASPSSTTRRGRAPS